MTPSQLGIIIVLLATTLLGATGALVYRMTQRTNHPARETTSVSPTQTPSQSGSSSSEASQEINNISVPDDWKTYSNKELEFEITYPMSMEIVQEGWQRIDNNPRGYWLLNLEDNSTSSGVLIDYRENPKTAGGAPITQVEQSVMGVENLHLLDVQGYPALTYEIESPGRQFDVQASRTKATHVLKGTTLWQIRGIVFGSNTSNIEEYEKIIQILSTFKFTISNPEKLLIDSWLKGNNLNQYGDPKDTMYAGGTPLFDERTGERMDRYEYILKKYPDRPWSQ